MRAKVDLSVWTAFAAGLLLMTGCGGSSGDKAGMAPATKSTLSDTPTAASSGPMGESPAPATRSSIPDGVYRTQITADALTAAGVADLSNAGTWTLTVHSAAYRLACRPVSDRGTDCGQDQIPALTVVEVGSLRGSGNRVWFVHDPAATSTLPACATGCPLGGYRLDWRLTSKGDLQFGNYVGLGDEAGGLAAVNDWTLQPWVRVQ